MEALGLNFRVGVIGMIKEEFYEEGLQVLPISEFQDGQESGIKVFIRIVLEFTQNNNSIINSQSSLISTSSSVRRELDNELDRECSF